MGTTVAVSLRRANRETSATTPTRGIDRLSGFRPAGVGGSPRPLADDAPTGSEGRPQSSSQEDFTLVDAADEGDDVLVEFVGEPKEDHAASQQENVVCTIPLHVGDLRSTRTGADGPAPECVTIPHLRVDLETSPFRAPERFTDLASVEQLPTFVCPFVRHEQGGLGGMVERGSRHIAKVRNPLGSVFVSRLQQIGVFCTDGHQHVLTHQVPIADALPFTLLHVVL